MRPLADWTISARRAIGLVILAAAGLATCRFRRNRMSSCPRGDRGARRFGFVCAADNNRTRGMLIQYNFCRKHSAIGCTPAEEAGLVIGGDNPWETLHKHAIWRRIKRGVYSAQKYQKRHKPRKRRGKKTAKKCDKLSKWIAGEALASV